MFITYFSSDARHKCSLLESEHKANENIIELATYNILLIDIDELLPR